MHQKKHRTLKLTHSLTHSRIVNRFPCVQDHGGAGANRTLKLMQLNGIQRSFYYSHLCFVKISTVKKGLFMLSWKQTEVCHTFLSWWKCLRIICILCAFTFTGRRLSIGLRASDVEVLPQIKGLTTVSCIFYSFIHTYLLNNFILLYIIKFWCYCN